MADWTERTGVDFHHIAGGDDYFVPRSIGSGAALFHADDDNRLDLFLIQNAGPGTGVKHQLYLQRSDGTFANSSDGSGLDVDGYGMGCAAGDINNDGRVDLLLTEYGGVRLFLNETQNGNVRFREVTREAGLQNPAWGTSASFFDYDRDGWLDLVIANYFDYDPSRRCMDVGGRQDFCGPQVFAPLTVRLFRNQGLSAADAAAIPRFDDTTVASGMATHAGKGLGIVCSDFTGDGWPDVFVANDGVANTLWVNRRDGTFVEEAGRRGLAYNALGEAEADMGIALGDVNHDGWDDVFVTHRANETHTLWIQRPVGQFADQTPVAQITRTAWRGTGFGTALSDLDNDEDLDLLLVSGRVLRYPGELPETPPDVDGFWRAYAQRDQIMVNDGTGKFQDASSENPEFSTAARVSRGLACGDLDNDGRVDCVVTAIAGPARVFRNVAEHAGNYLLVRAVDPRWKRDAYGARVKLFLGQRRLQREINPAYSYLSSNDPRAHFGLAQHEDYDRIRVLWPDGMEEEFPGGRANQLLTLTRGGGTILDSAQEGSP